MVTIRKSAPRSAFTLVELSIVLVIIGLLVGGIFVGKNMVRAAEMRSVMTDASNYISAVHSFRTQYNYLPGDLSNASSYWAGSANGNVDGIVSGAERFSMWAHLHNAGLVDVKFTGAQGGGGAEDFIIGGSPDPNVPGSRVADSGFSFYYLNHTGGGNFFYNANYGNMLTYGGKVGVSGGPPITAILSATDAASMDQKMDDGKPGTGVWMANGTGGGNFGSTTACTTSADATDITGSYQTANTVPSCSFFIKSGY